MVGIDGSDTVFAIQEAAVTAYQATGRDEITVGGAGTGAGFKKFIEGQIDIADASRPISQGEDRKLAAKGRKYFEIVLAYDGLCVVVNPKNQWLQSITLGQLHKIWDKDSNVKMWSDVDPSWPKQEIKLVGPTSAHGTYEYFNNVVNGDGKNARQDYSQQTQYDGVVSVVGREKNALGYMGFSYAALNAKTLRILPVDAGSGPVAPSEQTILDGRAAPFSRPLLCYVDAKAYEKKPAVKRYVDFLVQTRNIVKAVEDADYVPLPDDLYRFARDTLRNRDVGSLLLRVKPGTPYDKVVAESKRGRTDGRA